MGGGSWVSRTSWLARLANGEHQAQIEVPSQKIKERTHLVSTSVLHMYTYLCAHLHAYVDTNIYNTHIHNKQTNKQIN